MQGLQQLSGVRNGAELLKVTQKTRGHRDATHMKKSCTLRRNNDFSFSGDDGLLVLQSLLFGYLQIQEQTVTTTSKNLKINWKTDYLI